MTKKKKYLTAVDLDLVHNTHVLIPKDLYKEAKDRAKEMRLTMTDVIVEGLKMFLELRPVKPQNDAEKAN
jgi:hypothetical protein